MKPIVEPLEIRIEPNVSKKKSPSPPNKVSNNGLLTSETDQRRSSAGVSKLINTFQGNASHDLEQTVLVPRLRSPGQTINRSENVSHLFNVFFLSFFYRSFWFSLIEFYLSYEWFTLLVHIKKTDDDDEQKKIDAFLYMNWHTTGVKSIILQSKNAYK